MGYVVPERLQHIVLRTGIDIFRGVLNSLESKLTSNCIMHLNITNYSTALAVIKTKPMFSRYYMLYVTLDSLDTIDNMYLNWIIEISSIKWVILIIKTGNRTTFEQLHFKKPFDTFTYLDCFSVRSDILNRYIANRLLAYGAPKYLVTNKAITCIRRRVRYREYILDSMLPRLAATNLSRNAIYSLIAPYKGVTLSNFGMKLFDKTKSKPVGELMFRYCKYPDLLFKSTYEFVNKWFSLYELFVKGELSENNMLGWVNQSGFSYQITKEYQVKQWLSLLSTYSFEFMCIVFSELQDAFDKKNSDKIFALYRIFKMVNV